MESFSNSVLGKDPVTRRNRTLIGGAVLLGGIYYWMTQRHGENEPQRVAHDAKEKAKQEAERIQTKIEEKASSSRS
ncbi:g8952 [Coccomyxa viridis]|uniref:G8952 protein n=1 Tax=Coccomyxa viridis TaxID=1274662 RepID=A0ABP1G6H4_9CHLO